MNDICSNLDSIRKALFTDDRMGADSGIMASTGSWWKPGLFAFGMGWFLVGVIVYLTARPPITPFMPSIHGIARMPHWLRLLLGPAPTFVHVLAFSMMSAAIVAKTRARQALVCAGWAVVEIVFEVAQHPFIRERLLRIESLSSMSFVSGFLTRSTFDFADILAAIVGGSLGGFLLCSNWRWLR
jgi:hypothetical protein